MMRKLALAFAALLALAAPALAQNVAPPVQQTGQRLDAAAGGCYLATAVNATQAAGTCTITPPAGQYVYFTTLEVGACMDGTASISGIQLNFTSTNLNGWVEETSTLTAATITTNPMANLCAWGPNSVGAVPLKSQAPGGVVTIVPPAQTAHMSFPIKASYYFSP